MTKRMSNPANTGRRIDYHTHVLPEIDDGASNAEMSAEMLKMLGHQGIVKVAATPHYFMHDESPEQFLERRSKAFSRLKEHPEFDDFPEIILGAEVLIEPDVSSLELRPLCIGDTDMLLIELPHIPLRQWAIEEIQNILYSYRIVPVIAHIDRYSSVFSNSNYEQLLALEGCAVQFNTAAFLKSKTVKIVKQAVKKGVPVFIGSDSHNISDRAPNYDQVDRMIDKLFKNNLPFSVSYEALFNPEHGARPEFF